MRPLPAPAARLRQTCFELRVVRVKPQADDVNGMTGKGDGNLGAGEVLQTLRFSGSGGTVLAADLVVVSQCPQLHAIGARALSQCLGGEGAIGNDRVAMEIGVEDGSHATILVLRRWHNAP